MGKVGWVAGWWSMQGFRGEDPLCVEGLSTLCGLLSCAPNHTTSTTQQEGKQKLGFLAGWLVRPGEEMTSTQSLLVCCLVLAWRLS